MATNDWSEKARHDQITHKTQSKIKDTIEPEALSCLIQSDQSSPRMPTLANDLNNTNNTHLTDLKYKSFVNGLIAGTVAKAITIPFDRLKILIQTQQPRYKNVGFFQKDSNGIYAALKSMYNENAMFRSQKIALCRHGIHGGLGFLIRDTVQEGWNSKERGDYAWYKHFFIGAIAGCGATAITTPLDTIRVRHTSSKISYSYKDVWRDLAKPQLHSGKNKATSGSGSSSSIHVGNSQLTRLQNLYAGHVASQVGVCIYAGLNFGFKDTLTEVVYKNESLRGSFFKEGDQKRPEWYCSFVSGFFAAVLTQMITYPLEVVKRRKQYVNSTYSHIIKEIWKSGNYNEIRVNIYRGFSINIIRHPIVNGLVWTIKETLDQTW